MEKPLFLGYVGHDTVMYLIEKTKEGCKVLLHYSPCSSCSNEYFEETEETFCDGWMGTFRCSNCHIEE